MLLQAASSIFQHAGPGHVLANATVLVLFAPGVGRVLNWWRLVALFLLAGVLANQVAAALIGRHVIGASGAAAGIMAAHLVLFPRSRLALLIALWIALQAVFVGIALDFGGVAWPAHLVGVVIGTVAALVFRSTRRRISLA